MRDIPEVEFFRSVNSSTATWVLFWSIIVLLVGGVIVYRRLRRRDALQLPTCRDCGYAVFGLPSTVRPECGAQLNGGGTLPPGAMRPIGRGRAMLMWTASAAAIAASVTLLAFWANWLPIPASRSFGLELRSPSSGDYDDLRVDWGCDPSIQSAFGNPPAAYVAANLQRNGRMLRFEWHRSTDRSVYRINPLDNSVHEFSGDPTMEHILDWMRHVGVDTEKPRVQAEAAALLGLMLEIGSGRQPDFAVSNDAAAKAVAEHFLPSAARLGLNDRYFTEDYQKLLAGFWLSFWAVGAVIVFWRTRRPRRGRSLRVKVVGEPHPMRADAGG